MIQFASDAMRCECCGEAFSKRKNENYADYALRRFCSVACYRKAWDVIGYCKPTPKRMAHDSPFFVAAVREFGPDDPMVMTFARAYERAYREGRLAPDIAIAHGLDQSPHACPVCGMRAWSAERVARCCAAEKHNPWCEPIQETQHVV